MEFLTVVCILAIGVALTMVAAMIIVRFVYKEPIQFEAVKDYLKMLVPASIASVCIVYLMIWLIKTCVVNN